MLCAKYWAIWSGLNILPQHCLVMSYGIGSFSQHWFRQWLVSWLSPSHDLAPSQCWLIINSPLGNKKTKTFSFKKMHLKMSAKRNILILLYISSDCSGTKQRKCQINALHFWSVWWRHGITQAHSLHIGFLTWSAARFLGFSSTNLMTSSNTVRKGDRELLISMETWKQTYVTFHSALCLLMA